MYERRILQNVTREYEFIMKLENASTVAREVN